jgi:hypothetical protein
MDEGAGEWPNRLRTVGGIALNYESYSSLYHLHLISRGKPIARFTRIPQA